MRDLVDADDASLPTSSSTGGDAPQQSEIVSRGNSVQQSVYTATAENVGPEPRGVGMLVGHTRVSKSVDDGEVKACWECCTQHVGRTEARTWPGRSRTHLELSERWRAKERIA